MLERLCATCSAWKAIAWIHMRHVYYYCAITKEIVIFILGSRLGAFFKVLLLIKAEIKSRL